jgi:hypothetical protein
MSLAKAIEKTPMQSKKFLAYLLSNIINKLIIFWMVQKGVGGTTIAWTVTAAAFIDIGYILGQAALDGFVRMAQIKGPFKNKTLEEKESDSNQDSV